MSDWATFALDDIATIRIGGTPPRDVDAYWAGESDPGFAWVSIADLNGRIVSETKERITEKGVRNSNVKLIKKGSLMMSFKLSIGRAALAGVELFTNEAIAVIDPKDQRVSQELLYYVLPPQAKSAITDTAVKGVTLNKASLGKLSICVPTDQAVQIKIAHILQTIDDTIEKTEALIEKYQQIKAGLMHDLFTRGIGADGKLRPPREQAPELYQQTPLGWIPKEWEFSICSDVCENVIDCKNRTPPITPDGYPVIRTPNVRDGVFVDRELVFTDRRSYEVWTARGKPVPEDIVITREAPVGEVCKIPERHTQACLGQRMMLYRADPSKILNDFFLYVLQSRAIQNRLDLISGGSTVGHVRVGDICNLWIFYPKRGNEQKKIAGSLNAISRKIETENNRLSKLKMKKHGLMHDLLTGQVQVNVAPPEAALV